MSLPKFTLYKYIRLDSKWRYCKAAYHSNGKVKPNVVWVSGNEQHHKEGSYYLYSAGRWIAAGADALEADKQRRTRLARLEYQRLSGNLLPHEEKQQRRVKLEDAVQEYLSEIDVSVRAKNKRQGTYDLMANSLKKFSALTKLQHLSDIRARHLDEYAAWVIQTSPTHSTQTGRNEYLRVLQFLKSRGVLLKKKQGDKEIPVGMKDGPKVTQGKRVITNTSEELAQFFSHCRGLKEHATFETFHRAGLREMELATMRWPDVVLESVEPYIDVDDRDVDGYEFRPKWYARRHVSIDPELVAELKKLRSISKGELVFGTSKGHIDYHLLRKCKRIAKRAGLAPKRFRLHRFRANYATHCLRQGMDLETLREQLGHRDTEALRCYIDALRGEERASKVAKVWAAVPIQRPGDAAIPRADGQAGAVLHCEK